MRYGLLSVGLLSLAAAWWLPIPFFDRHTFWGHMVMHMLVVAAAAPMLALAVAGSKLDPVSRIPKILSPLPVSIAELIAVWAWHSPALHHAARHTVFGILAEQATFLIAGLAMWISACGGNDGDASPRRAAGVVGLLLTSMHMTLLGALLALAPRPLFEHHHGHGTLTALEDQHLGGAIMLLTGGISYMLGGLGLTVGLVRPQHRRQETIA